MDRFDLVARELRHRAGRQHLDDFTVCETVPREEAFDRHTLVAEALRFGRGTPFAPHLHAELKVESLNDGVQIRCEATASFEFADDRVVSLDELEADVGVEILGVGRRDMVPAADERRDPIDEIEILKEDVYRFHPLGSTGGTYPRLFYF